MRLRFGPHASRLAEQVVVTDPLYVLAALASPREGVLARVFRELIAALDARPLVLPCARCRGQADGVCAYPASTTLIGFCERCLLVSTAVAARPAIRIGGYEDALRHVALSCPRSHRIETRRIVRALLAAKGGPERVTEAEILAFFERPRRAVGRRP